jgi:hypothetical protein
MTKKSIKLHPEHGLNATMPICFWCGKEDGTIAFLGNTYNGEAPRKMVLNYDRCTACANSMAHGIAVIECDANADRAPLDPKNPDSVPSGRWAVMTSEGAERLFGKTEQWPEIAKSGRVLIDTKIWQHLGFPSTDS